MQHKLLLRTLHINDHKFQSDTSMQMCASRHIMSQAIYILRRLLVGFVYVIEASMFAPLKGHLFWTSVQQDFLNAAWLWFYDWDELTHLSLQNIVFQQVPTVILGFSFHSPTSGFQRFYLPEVAAAYNGTEYVQACLILQCVIWEYTALCWIQPFSLQHFQRPNGLFRSTCWWKLSLKFYCTRDVNEVLNFMEYLRGNRSQAIHRSKVMVVKLLNQRLAIFILLSLMGNVYIFSPSQIMLSYKMSPSCQDSEVHNCQQLWRFQSFATRPQVSDSSDESSTPEMEEPKACAPGFAAMHFWMCN